MRAADQHAAPASSQSEPRYVVSRLDGYLAAAAPAGGQDDPPGATFTVTDRRTGSVVGRYRSEEVAGGLPAHVRVNIAALRAELRIRELELADAATSIREPEAPPCP